MISRSSGALFNMDRGSLSRIGYMMDGGRAIDRLHLIIVLSIVLHRLEERDPDEETAHDSTDISLLAPIEHRIDRLIALLLNTDVS